MISGSLRLSTKCHNPNVTKFNPRLLSFNARQKIAQDDNVSRHRWLNALVHINEMPPNVAQPTSSLCGVDVAVKDNICTSSMPTTCSSAMLRDFKPPFNATVVDLLEQSGARITGKTNCDEFGMGSLNLHSFHGPVYNPYSMKSAAQLEQRSAGGSSGGSAAAVAADMCHVALATDTGGSTRLPASYCGIIGLKPSYGLISRWGVISFADSLDCVGVMGKTVGGVQKVFDVLNVHDPKDPTSIDNVTRSRALEAGKEVFGAWMRSSDSIKPLRNLRIGIPQEYFPSELTDSVLHPFRRAVERFKSLGATIIPVSLPSTEYALSAYYVLASAEASSNMARYDGVRYGKHVKLPPGVDKTKAVDVFAHTRSANFGSEVQKRILLGAYALTADAFDNYFLQAQRVRRHIRADFDKVFLVDNSLAHSTTKESKKHGVHVLLHPSAIRRAPQFNEVDDGPELDVYVQDVLTVPASLAGLPAINIPIEADDFDGWPVGVTLVGQWGTDTQVMDVGKIMERVSVSRLEG